MAVIQARSRKEIRQSIGENLDAVHISTATGGTTTTVVDSSLTTVIGGNDDHIGKWVVFTSGDNDGTIARITDYVASSTTLTVQPTLANAVANGVTYELWDGDYPPRRIHDFINQAIISATGHVYDPIEDVSLHSDGHTLRFDIPSNISMIQNIYYRDKVEAATLHSCNSAFDEALDNDFTISVDTEDKKQGTGANKFEIAVGATGGEFVADSITSKDISKYDYLECWIKSTVATSAGNLKIHLDNGTVTADGNDLESLNIPALTADTWTFVRIALSNPETDTAIISVGLEYDSDLGACTVWVDDISVVRNDTGYWIPIPRNLWRIDKQSQDIVFDKYLDALAPYSLFKIVGGDKPALLSADSTSNEISDEYVTQEATARAFHASNRMDQARVWFALSGASRRNFPMLTNVRTVN